MKEPSARVVITFHTTAAAMASERLFRDNGLPGRLTPAPRALSADCGIAWTAPGDARDRLEAALTEAMIEFAGVHVLTA